jgi:hypothetical protein
LITGISEQFEQCALKIWKAEGAKEEAKPFVKFAFMLY